MFMHTTDGSNIEILGRCNACFKAKKSTKYCRITRKHQGEKAAPCSSCFEQGFPVSLCRLTHNHCGPGVHWLTATVNEKRENLPQCCFELQCVTFTTSETNIAIDPTATLAYLGPQTPQDYAHGFFTQYSIDKWKEWQKSFGLQTGTVLKLCTGSNSNKETNSGVLKRGSQVIPYTVSWRQQYTCFRGGRSRYKPNKEGKKPRNAPGSRLTKCTATLNVRLLKLECGEQLLAVTFPLPSAHSGHSLKSLADLHSYKPLPEIITRVESLVCNSHLSQISLMLALKEWVNKELIPDHLNQGQLMNKPSEYDRRYYPTVQDLRNMTKSVINKVRNNMFDQDALENFLKHESEQHQGFRYFLRKYKTTKDEMQ